MKFSDYNKTKNKSDKTSNETLTQGQEKILKDFLSNYEGKNRQDLIDEIVQVAKNNRRLGTLTDADLDKFSAMLMPIINDEQKEDLKKILLRLKSD